MKRSIQLICLSAALTLGGCEYEEPTIPSTTEDKVPLELHVSTGMMTTKGIIRGTALPDGSVLGLGFTEYESLTYDGESIMNIAYASSRKDGTQVWDAVDGKILLSNTLGKLYAYYPYSESVTSLQEIPVKATSEHQVDYMYANPYSGICKSSPTVNLTLKHALSAVGLIITRGTYSGEGIVTSASIKGEAMAGSAIFNAMDGTFSSLNDIGVEVRPDIDPITINSNKQRIDIMTIPSGTASTLDVELCIDGQIVKITSNELSFTQGCINNLYITIDKGSAFITNTEVTEWIHDSTSNRLDLEEYSVTFAGDMDGLSFKNSVDEDGNVTIIAAPYYREYTEVKPVTITGDATLVQTLDETTGNMAITLSDINSDVTVNFDSYHIWIQAEFEISDVTQETKVMGVYYNGNGVDRMRVDGVDIGVVEHYQFPSPGTYLVEYACTEKTKVRNCLFQRLYQLSSVIIPEGVSQIDTWAFSGSTLKEVTIPSTMKNISYQVFQECSKLQSATIPDECWFGIGLFKNCTSLTYTKLPSDLTEIPDHTFEGCTSLSHFDMPPGITSIGYAAFAGTGFESFQFPDAITEIDVEVLKNCRKLKEVRLPANLTKIGRQAFAFCNVLERVIHADGTIYEGEFFIPEGVTEIDNLCVYFESPSIKSIRIPSTLVDIEAKGLANRIIEMYTLNKPNPKYEIRNCCVVETATNTLVAGSTLGGVIDGSITVIGAGAFYESKVPVVDLHANITELQDEAFSYTRSLTVISRALTPPVLGTDSIRFVEYYGTLKVPEEALETYRTEWMKNEVGYIGYSALKWTIKALAEGE